MQNCLLIHSVNKVLCAVIHNIHGINVDSDCGLETPHNAKRSGMFQLDLLSPMRLLLSGNSEIFVFYIFKVAGRKNFLRIVYR